MPTKTLTPEQILCFNAAVEITSAAIVNGVVSSDIEAVKDYMCKIYPSLENVVQRIKH